MSALVAPRRYSILITRVDPGSDATTAAGTWHSVTATSLSEVLRTVRSGAFRDVAGITFTPGESRVAAVECLSAF